MKSYRIVFLCKGQSKNESFGLYTQTPPCGILSCHSGRERYAMKNIALGRKANRHSDWLNNAAHVWPFVQTFEKKLIYSKALMHTNNVIFASPVGSIWEY